MSTVCESHLILHHFSGFIIYSLQRLCLPVLADMRAGTRRPAEPRLEQASGPGHVSVAVSGLFAASPALVCLLHCLALAHTLILGLGRGRVYWWNIMVTTFRLCLM